MRVLIASHYTSEAMGGEAAIPLRLFDRLRQHGVDAWLVAHDGDRAELTERFADCPDRLILTRGWRSLSQVFTFGQKLPDGLRSVAWGITQVERQQAMVGEIRKLVRELSIDVVHQPIGIAPNMPSPLTRLGAPLVVGPLNGGLSPCRRRSEVEIPGPRAWCRPRADRSGTRHITSSAASSKRPWCSRRTNTRGRSCRRRRSLDRGSCRRARSSSSTGRRRTIAPPGRRAAGGRRGRRGRFGRGGRADSLRISGAAGRVQIAGSADRGLRARRVRRSTPDSRSSVTGRCGPTWRRWRGGSAWPTG